MTPRIIIANTAGRLTTVVILLQLFTCPAYAKSTNIIVKSSTITTHYTAFAQVRPITVLPVNAQQAGLLMDMHIVSGESLKAGQKIGRLGGPEIKAQLVQSKAQLRSAQAQLVASRKALTFQKQQRRLQLTTKLAVFQAESRLAQAKSALKTDQGKLRALRQVITLTAPVDGKVLEVDAANGERLAAGQPLLTLQPAHRLWLKAAYYGEDSSMIQSGMTGYFLPANGSHSIKVKVRTVFSMLAPDGGEGIGLLAVTPAPSWHNGEFGKVTINGPVRTLVAVPTRALILDQGKWWVMVHTATGDQPHQVVPGQTRGWQTFIVHGLEPGTEILVDGAYLEFHRNIAQRYQLPD